MTQNDVNYVVYDSPWKNAYWFARMLLNTDQYGALGKKETLMLSIVTDVEAILDQSQLTDEDKLLVSLKIIRDKIQSSSKKESKTSKLYEDFLNVIEEEITGLLDVVVFIVTIKYIVLPANRALNNVPNNDKEFCHSTAKNILDTLGKEKVGKVIAVWDTLGVRGCLNVERREIIQEFTKLRSNLNALSYPHAELEDNAILTAFAQEFERRAGQKRKSRAGGSLENVSTFLFDYYGFKSHEKPDHFQTDLEVDKWFKCKDGWLIGISCKRTLRERWKQVSSADNNVLSKYKIKEIWHLITYDRDLSDDKITMLGQQRHIFYLSDESPIYQYAKNHIGMCNYVRPLSQLIDNIEEEQTGKKKNN